MLQDAETKNWKFKGMRSFKFLEIFLFFLCVVICCALYSTFLQTQVESLLKSFGYSDRRTQIRLSQLLFLLVIIPPAFLFAVQYAKRKIDFWSVSLQGSTLHILFKQKEWTILTNDIHSILFREVHFGNDNQRTLILYFKGEKLKIFLPEKGFVSNLSASDFEMIDDFFSSIQEHRFFANEKVKWKGFAPENIAKITHLTK